MEVVLYTSKLFQGLSEQRVRISHPRLVHDSGRFSYMYSRLDISVAGTVFRYWSIHESFITSSSMRLNSSKQAQAPDWAKPLKNLLIAL